MGYYVADWLNNSLIHQFNGLVRERRNSSVLAVEFRLSCTNLSIQSIHSLILTVCLAWLLLCYQLCICGLTHWCLGDVSVIWNLSLISRLYILNICCEFTLMWMISLMFNQHWFRKWLGAVIQQAICWNVIAQFLSCHITTMSQYLRYHVFCTNQLINRGYWDISQTPMWSQ